MIDFHTHSLLSDGVLIPSELARRALVAGYEAMAITDHVDESNIETVVRQIKKAAAALNKVKGLVVIPGVELTHIPPAQIPLMVKNARSLGAAVVVGHGETLAEPVAPGTNEAYIKAGVDILAHPGLVSEQDARMAAKKGVHFEITSRPGHSISNGHVAKTALACGVRMVLNTDSHSPGDLISDDRAEKIALGAGLTKTEYGRIRKNAKELLEKLR